MNKGKRRRARHVVDVLDTATGARRQPLIFEITNSGYDRHSICLEHHEYSIKVLEGMIQNDCWFGYVGAPMRATTGATRRCGARSTRASASRSKRMISRAKPRRRSRCRARRTPSGACTSTSGPSRPSAGSTWRRGTPAMRRSTSRRCGAGPASAGSTSRPRPTSPRSPGCSRPMTRTGSGVCCRATSCPRTICRKRAERDRVPYDLWAARASSRRRRATSSTTARSRSGFGATAAVPRARDRLRPLERHPHRAAAARRGRHHGRVPPGLPFDVGADA